MATIYNMEPYQQKLYSPDLYVVECRYMAVDEYIRHLGFTSCRFDYEFDGCWEMSDEEFTWFVLRFR